MAGNNPVKDTGYLKYVKLLYHCGILNCKYINSKMASKPNQWVTGGSVWFQVVSVVLNKDSCFEQNGTGG